MSKQVLEVKMARATDEDIALVGAFLDEMENYWKNITPFCVMKKYVEAAESGSFERVVLGYHVLRDSLCDPNLSYLDVKPEIKAVEAAANDARLALAKLWNDMRTVDRYYVDPETQELCMRVLGLTYYTQTADEGPDAAAKEE